MRLANWPTIARNLHAQDGNTALHLAAERGNFHVVDKLLRNGANAKAKNSVSGP